MKALGVAELDRLRVARDRYSVGRAYNKLVLSIKAEAIAEVLRAFSPDAPISVLRDYHDKLTQEANEN